MDVNRCSVDGWLPFQLALALNNKNAMEILTKQTEITGLNLDYPTPRGLTIFSLIDKADP